MVVDEALTFDVTLLKQKFRIKATSRSKAVTQALEEFKQEHPDNSFPLSILRLRAKTKVVDLESEALDGVLESQMRKRV